MKNKYERMLKTMKRFLSLILALVLLCPTLCACDEDTMLETLGEIFGEEEKTPVIKPALSEATAELTKSISFEKTNVSVSEMPDKLLDFALELFDECADDENTVVSPYSVIYSLAMVQGGAAGKTLGEFEKLTGLKRKELEDILHAYLSSQGDELKAANSIWIRNSFKDTVKTDYLERMKKTFAGEVFSAAFDNETLKDINKYISDNTNGLIENALDEISDESVMMLINTVYFNAKWSDPYFGTTNAAFTNLDGTESKADFLHSTEWSYISDGKAEGFIKKYEGGRYAFAAILPNKSVELDDYADSLTGKKLKKMLAGAEYVEVRTKMPKFETHFKTDKLADVLRDMGLKRAFKFGSADFTDMADTDELFVSRVIHDAFIRVDETGTEAGAATIWDMKCGAAIREEEYKTVHLDRPFMYVIFDTQTYAPIFIGQITNM